MIKAISKHGHPREIESLQWDGTLDSIDEIKAAFPDMVSNELIITGRLVEWSIKTKYGWQRVYPNEYIIKDGTYHPCKPQMFAESYEIQNG
ncbi:MAG: hypothetical protein PHQ40_19790 [Anaerolineaceae bacterium]|nr:hypothetical protein [Anaerolineaceae bacterium]